MLALGSEKLAADDALRAVALAELGALAADCVARAVARGVDAADSLGASVGYRARFA